MAATNSLDCLQALSELVHNPLFENLPDDKSIPIVLGKFPQALVYIMLSFDQFPGFLAGGHLFSGL
jgi:hypothetical protein